MGTDTDRDNILTMDKTLRLGKTGSGECRFCAYLLSRVKTETGHLGTGWKPKYQSTVAVFRLSFKKNHIYLPQHHEAVQALLEQRWVKEPSALDRHLKKILRLQDLYL